MLNKIVLTAYGILTDNMHISRLCYLCMDNGIVIFSCNDI